MLTDEEITDIWTRRNMVARAVERAATAPLQAEIQEQARLLGMSAEREATLLARIAELESLSERLKQEAQIHAQEARTANSTIAEIYQACSGATGEPGNWHGAEPVRRRIAELEAARIAYASEFPPVAAGDDAGLPDVGNIHANIRSLKAKLAEAQEDAARYRWLRGFNNGSVVIVEITSRDADDWVVLAGWHADAAVDADIAAQEQSND